MQQFYFFESFLFFLSTYVIGINSVCFEDNTYFINAGYEKFPSTQEKSADLCQGSLKLNLMCGDHLFKIHFYQNDAKENENVLFGCFTSLLELVTYKLGK